MPRCLVLDICVSLWLLWHKLCLVVLCMTYVFCFIDSSITHTTGGNKHRQSNPALTDLRGLTNYLSMEFHCSQCRGKKEIWLNICSLFTCMKHVATIKDRRDTEKQRNKRIEERQKTATKRNRRVDHTEKGDHEISVSAYWQVLPTWGDVTHAAVLSQIPRVCSRIISERWCCRRREDGGVRRGQQREWHRLHMPK